MADKTDLPDDDELDIDGLDDIDFDSPEFGGEDNRDPVTRFKAAAVDSALDPDTYVGVTRAIAKNALPREYSEAYNSVEDTLKFITDTGRETADKVKKPINDLRDFVTDTIEEMDDSGNETIEKIKKTVLGFTSREREGSDEHAKQRDYDGEAIAATLGSIFDGQKAQLEGMRSKDKQDRLSTKLNKARDQASLEFSGLTNQLLARMVGYQDSILFEYQKKDLELQHRQYYALRDILSAIKGGLVAQTEANAAIVKNTGLPDWKKSTIGEDYKSEAFNKIYGSVNETVGQYNEKFFGRFKDNIKAKIDGGIEDFAAGVTQGLDAAQQVRDLTDGMDSFAMAGSMGTPIVLESIAGRLGKKFASKIAKYPSIANIADDLGYFLANSPQEVTDFMKNWDGKPFPGWLIEKYPFLDKVNARMIADQLQELMPGLANQQLTMANTLHQTAMEEVGWDVMSRKSLVEIIPGFLSRILEQATIANGGSGRVVYSAQQEAFVDLDTAIESTKSAMFTDIQTRRNRALDDAVSSVKGGELSDAVKTKLGKIMLARALRNEPFRAERIVEDTAWTDEEREQVTAFFTLGEENPRLLRRMFTDAMKEMARGQDDMQKFINTTYATGGADVLIASGLVKEDKSGQREMLSRENKDKFLSKLYENRKKVRNKVSIGSLDELFALVEGVDPAVAEKIKEFIRQDKKVLKEVVKLAEEEDPRKIIAKFNELEDRLTKSTKKFVFDNDMVSDIMFGQGNDSTTYGNSRVPDEIVTPRMFTDVANMANNAKTFTKDKFKRFTDGAQAKADSIRTSPWVMQLMRAMRDKDIETLKKLITDEQNITFLKSKFKESRVNSLIKRAESFIKSHEAQYNNVKDTVSAKTEEFAAFAEDKIGKNRIRRIKAGGRLAKRKGRRLRGAAEEKLEEIKTSQWLADAKEAVEDRDIDKLKSHVTDNEAITALRETMDNTSVNDVVDRLKTTVKEQTEQAKEAAKEKYESSGAKAKVDGLVADAQEKYEVSGAKARVDELTDNTTSTYKSAKDQLEEFIENGKKTFDREHWAQIDNFNQNLIKKQTEAARLWREELAKKASETAERVKPKRYRADRKEPTIEEQQEEQLEEQDTSAVNEVNRLVEYTLRQDFIELEGKAGLPVHVLSLPGLNKSDDPTSSSNTEMIDFLRGSFSEVSQILAMVAYNTDQIAKGTGDGKSKGSLFMRLMGKVERGGKSAVGIIPKILTSYFSGVTKMAHAGLGIGGSIIKGGISAAGSVGSFLLMRDKIRDIYVKGKDAPVLFADRLKMGQYFDVATGKKIKRIKDIKGPVRDMDGNIVLTQEDIAAGLYNPYSKLDLSIGGMIGGVSKLFGKAMSLNFKVMKKLVTVPGKFLIGSEYLLKSAGDVYVKGEEHPRLTKFIMMRGGYFDAGTGDPIKVLGDIKGEVKDNQGNVLLSNDDIRKGLVDKNGRAINSSRLANIIRGAFRVGGKLVGGVAKGALKLAGAGLKAGATIAKAAGGLASNLMPWNWSKWGTKSNDMMASEEAVSTLKSILQLLDERLQKPKRKIFGDTDGDGDRDGSLADLMGRRSKNKRPVKVKVPEEGEKKESAWGKILGVLGPLGMILGAGFSAVTSAVGAMGSLVVGAVGTIASGIAAVLGPIITSGLGAVAGLLGKVIKAISAARAASAASDVVDDLADGVDGPDGDKKNKKGRGKGKGAGRAAGKARGFFGRMVDGAMDLGGKAKDLVVEKGGKAAKAVKGQAGKAAQLVSGQVAKQTAKIAAGQAAKKAAVAATGAGAAAVAGSGALGAAAVAAAPLVATGVAVAGAAYTGYEIGNWAWKKWADVEELERLRFLQYGINPDDQDQVQMIRSLEEEFVDEVSWRSNTSPDFKLSPSEALEMWAENMGVDIQIPAHAEEWVTWFSKRFYPIVMNHLITCKNLGDINLNDVDDEIDEKRIPSYLSSVTVKYRYREKGDPFAVVASPFPGYYLQTNELAIAMYTDSLFAKYGIANPVSLASLVPKDAKETDGKAESDKVEEYEAGKAIPKNAETSVTRQVDKAKLDTIDPQPSQLESSQLAAKEEPRFNKPDPASAPTQIAPAPVEPPKVKLPDTNTPVANPAGSGMVKYMRPCKGPITSPYGMRVHPIKKVQKMHKGIDIGAPGGTPIYASAAGSIFRADYSSSYGNVVYIRHANGWSTRYAHMQKFGPGIATGVSVQQGQLIGYVGNTGASAGNHLHFEMRTGSNYDSPTVDPAQYIGAASEIKAINASVKLEDQATLDGTLEGHNTFTGMPESTQPTDKVINVGGRTIVIRDEVSEGSTDPVGNMDGVNRGNVDPSMDAPVNQTYDNVKSINNSSTPNVPSAGGDSGYVPTYTGVPGFDKTPGSSSSSSDREFGSYEPVSTTRMGTPESNAGINTQMQQMEQAAEDESIKHLRSMASGIARLVTIAESLGTSLGKAPAAPRETARGVNTNTAAEPKPASKAGPSNGGMGKGSTVIKPPVDVRSR